jgi:hypothetical protein
VATTYGQDLLGVGHMWWGEPHVVSVIRLYGFEQLNLQKNQGEVYFPL